MKKYLVYIIIAIAIGIPGSNVWGQSSPPFYGEIQGFKKQDSIQFPPKNAILFVGSSSFRMWRNVQQDFPKYTIINRGFGGSSLPDVIRYADDIIFPYHPKQIIIYCGENDIASSDTITADVVYNRFRKLFQLIRVKMPDVPVAFVSMKPSPSRERFLQTMQEGNNKIKSYLQQQKNAVYIDVYHKMLQENGSPMTDIFLGDNLHMNAKGYAIWTKIIGPYLVK